MRLLYLAAIAALAYLTPSQAQRIATVVVYVTVPPSSTTDAAIVPQSASIEHQQQEDQSTLSPLSSKSEVTTSTSSSSPTPTSHVEHQATSSQTYPEVTAAASTASTYYEPGQSGGGIDTEEGASGSDAAAFRLSKGGLAAILIVVILVSLFGSKYDDITLKTYTNTSNSRKHHTLHRRQTKAVDHAPDSHTSVPPSDWPLHSTQDSTDRNRSEQKIPPHWNPDGQPAAPRRESRIPSRPQERSRRRCQGSRERSTAAGRQGTNEHQTTRKHLDPAFMG
jgi:hypothetical protein